MFAGWVARAWRFRLNGSGSPGQIAVSGGLVFAVAVNEAGKQATLHVIGLDDGKERWQFSWAATGTVNVDGKRAGSMPAVATDMVYLIGPTEKDEAAMIRAVDLKTHKEVWCTDPVIGKPQARWRAGSVS